MKPDTNPAPAPGASQAGQPPAFPLTAGSPAPQGPTGDDILNRFRLGKHIVEVKAQLKYLENWAAQLDRDIAGKRAAVQGNNETTQRGTR